MRQLATGRTNAELQGDRNPAPRPGETPAETQARARAAEDEILRRAPEVMDALGETPRRVSLRGEEGNHPDAHTIERHGPDIPLRRADAPGGRTVEGRVFGDPPWGDPQNASFRWLNDSVMNRVVNDYLRANWERIKLDLATDGRHTGTGDAGNAVGEGFINPGQGGLGPRSALYMRTSLFRLTIRISYGPPVGFYIVTAFPNALGAPGH